MKGQNGTISRGGNGGGSQAQGFGGGGGSGASGRVTGGIAVTSGETLQLQIGWGGNGGIGAQHVHGSKSKGTDGTDGYIVFSWL